MSTACRNACPNAMRSSVPMLNLQMFEPRVSAVGCATGTPEPDGLMPEEAMQILQAIAAEYPITGGDMMEIAPFTDSSGLGLESREKTLKVAGDISAFLIGEMSK